MEAVSPSVPVSIATSLPPRPRAPEPPEVGSTALPAPPEQSLSPALPAAVQRTHLDPPPPPKLMTREEMAALLLLAVGGAT